MNNDLVLRPDGTGFMSPPAAEVPIAPQATDPNSQTQTTPPELSADEIAMRQRMGLPIPQAQTPTAQPLMPGQKYSVQQLVEMGYIDPEGKHDLTKMTAYQTTVSSLQRQVTERDRYFASIEQQQRQAQEQLRQNTLRTQREQVISEADPSQREALTRQFEQQDAQAERDALMSRVQEMEDERELSNWERIWTTQERIPSEIIDVIKRVADQNGIRNAGDRYTFMNNATRRYLNDVATGRAPAPTPPTTQNPPARPAAPAQAGAPYVPVVAPAGTSGVRQSYDAMIGDAMQSTGDESEAYWRKVNMSLFGRPTPY